MTDASENNRSLEQRIQAIEDRLEILNLIAAHPPGADSASHDFAEAFWLADGTVDAAGQPKAYESMIGVLNTPGFAEAQRQGICHFAGLPHIKIDGDLAVVTSYLQILAADPDGKPFELSAHGTSKGFRVLRLSANRWELQRTPDGWRIKSRTMRGMDNPASRELLKKTTSAAA
ncbi:MAG TPA: nuclear transport factor 2 family protein [Stellaceae bacterium]|nr:nuclear transport factor 2 family protein [Stellaceae bacterium]